MKAILAILLIAGIANAGCLRCSRVPEISKEAQMNYHDVLNLITGILSQMNSRQEINELLSCIDHIPNVVNDIKTLIMDFKNVDWKDFNSVVIIFADLFMSISDLFNGLIPCSDIPNEMKKLVEKIGNMDLDNLLQRIMLKAFSLFGWVTNLIKYLKEENYSLSGQCIGKILYLILLDFDTELEIEEAIKFLKGFFEGLGVNSFEKFQECVKNIEPILAKFMEAIDLLSEMTFKSIVSAIIKIREGVVLILKAVENCSEGFEDLKKIVEQIEKADLKKIAQKIMDDPIVYLFKIMNIVNNIKNKQYEAAGHGLGQILKELIKDEDKSMESFALFMEGFIEGINQGHNFENITECVHSFPVILEDFEKVIEELKKVNWKNLDKLVEALINIFDAFNKILKAIKPCSKTPSEIDVIIEKVKYAINHLDEFLQKIQNNIVSIVSDFVKMLTHLKDGNYEEFGKDMGDIFYRLILK